MSKYKDPDIFGGGSEEPTFRDPEIFKTPEPEKETPKMEARPSERSFSQYATDRAKSVGMNLVRGLLSGGPLGLAIAGTREANQTIGDATDSVSYNAGGAVTDASAKVLPPEAAAALGYLTNLGTQAAVAYGTGKGLEKMAAPALDAAARRTMQMALKPPLEAHQKNFAPGVTKGRQAVHTLLTEGVNPTDVAKLEATRSALAAARQQELAKSGATISTSRVADYAPNALEKFRYGPLADEAVDVIGDVQRRFVGHQEIAGQADIPVQLAEKMKQGYQAAIGNKYGAISQNPTRAAIETEAEKQIARGLRELQAEAAPKASESLFRESALINAKKLAERRAAMSGNNQLMGLGWIANPLMWPLWLAERSPTIGGLMARGMYQGQNAIPLAAGSYAGGSYMANQGLAPGETPMLDLTGLGALYRK